MTLRSIIVKLAVATNKRQTRHFIKFTTDWSRPQSTCESFET